LVNNKLLGLVLLKHSTVYIQKSFLEIKAKLATIYPMILNSQPLLLCYVPIQVCIDCKVSLNTKTP